MAAAREALAALRAAGAHVVVIQADVARNDQMARVIAEVVRSMPPLRWVIHAASVLDDRPFLDQDPESLRRVLSPKVLGAWNLHKLTADSPLDFFVLFSSSASVHGAMHQANYTAANAYLDALAHYRQRQGLPATSINWGAWAEVGAAARLYPQRAFELGGHSLLATQVLAQVRQALQVPLSLRSFFKQPTVANLAAAVPEHHSSQNHALHTIGPKEAKELLARLDQLSDEKVDELLRELMPRVKSPNEP